MKSTSAAGAILLAACATSPAEITPPDGTAVITVSNVGSMFGSSSTQIFADGTIIRDSATAGAQPLHSVRQASPAAFATAAAVIAVEGRRTITAMAAHPDMCMDYGSDVVRADPPIAGFDQVATSCPDKAVTALMDHVLATLATP